MSHAVKKELFNEIVTGLLVACVFAAIMPADGWAQNLQAVGLAASQAVLKPFVEIVSYVSYSLGSVMTVAGIAGCKKHADNPGSNPLAPALGRLGSGAAFLSAPTVAGMLAGTATDSSITGTASYAGIGNF